MRAKFVNESIVGSIENFTVYKNPPSITRMAPMIRGLHDQDGNFYVADFEGEGFADIIHLELIDFVNEQDPNVKTSWENVDEDVFVFLDGIAWVREENTNTFKLAESYSNRNKNEWIGIVQEIMALPTFFVPFKVNFDLNPI